MTYRPSKKLQGEAHAAAIEARHRAREAARVAEAARPTTSTERVAFVTSRLAQEGYAARTVYCYNGELRRAEWWCEARGKTLLTMTDELVAEYVAERPNSFPTRKLIRAALGHYWRLLGREDPPLWLIRLPSKPKMVCRALEEKQAQALASYVRAKGGHEAFAVLLGMYQALRRQEIATLRWDCFRTEGWLDVVGKGEVSARVPVHPVIAKAMLTLSRTSPWVFPGRTSGHICNATVWDWTRKLAAEAGLGHVAPHLLRHTSLATAHDRTGDLKAVQDFARHAEISTTSGYTRTTTRRLIAAMEAINYDSVDPTGTQVVNSASATQVVNGGGSVERETIELRAEIDRLRDVIKHLASGEPEPSGPALEVLPGGKG